MIQYLNLPITVTLASDHRCRSVRPQEIVWQNRVLPVSQVGLHHTYFAGRTLYHVFSVVANELFFRLVFNTDSLLWTLSEIADGEAN